MTELKWARRLYYDENFGHRESMWVRCKEENTLYIRDWQMLVKMNDAEILDEALQNQILIDKFVRYLERLDEVYGGLNPQKAFQKTIDQLIDLAIESKSHGCYILLVEYKRKHNLYQANPFEL